MIFADVLLTLKSPKGNEIMLLSRQPEDFEKTILVIGVMHGDEPDGEYLINRYLSEKYDKNSLKNRLLFVPCLNPDGKAQNVRTNSNEVDLNRNFPASNWVLGERDNFFGGEKPASEMETQFLIYAIDRYKPDLILTLHEPYRVVNYDGPAEEFAKKISEITGYKIEENIGYPTPGSFGTYCGIEKNIPVITLELPEKQPKDKLWAENKGIFDFLTLL